MRVACYNVTHAIRFSKVNLSLLQSPQFEQIFPNPDCRVPERAASDEWSTVAREAKLDGNPSFKALGLGTGFTGLGVDNLVIDDPYKNAQSARSEAINVMLWDWYTDVVKPRLNPLTNVIVMFHRWWDGDFAGRLMEEGGWEMIRFPAIADDEGDDPTGRKEGELLSNRYPIEYLENIRDKTRYTFYSLYQGRPRAKEGNYFKREWFEFVPAVPALGTRVRYWDKAGAAEGKGDWTVGVLMMRDSQGLFYVEDVQRFQKQAADRNALILQTAQLDQRKYGSVSIYVEQPPGLAKEATDSVVRLLAGFVVHADAVHKDKETRAEPFAAQAQAHNVKVLSAPWTEAWLNELCDFPTGKHDDQVDASSGAFNKLADSAQGFTHAYDQRVVPQRKRGFGQ